MEIWKDAVGFEGYLQVSTEGRCKSLGRWIKDFNGEPKWKPDRIIAKGGKSKYKTVGATVDGEEKSCALHRLVAMTFIPNPEGKPVVNHIDGNTHNNAVSNLEWCTYSENVKHAWRTGLISVPKKTGPSDFAELRAEKVSRLREQRSELLKEIEQINKQLDALYPFWRTT